MKIIIYIIKSTKWFLISSVAVIAIAMLLSHLSTTTIGSGALTTILKKHRYLWLLLHAFIIIGFMVLWSSLVKKWSIKYQWDDDKKREMLQRKWRYAIWLIIIDFVFQLL